MELPRRAPGDELLRPGELTDIRARLRSIAHRHDLVTVIACAFDRRTRMLPFIFADTRMAPAGPRAIGSAMLDAGFEKTRIVLQHWNRNFRPSQMRLDGRVPDIFMVSSMSLHMARCREMLRDVRRIDPAHRPLIVVGGSVCMYEPWKLFSDDPRKPFSPDVAVTGEQYVLLEMLETLLAERAGDEPLRETFARARDHGALDEVPGLIYGLGDRDGVAEELVDTGIQRLVGDLDETAHPVHGYRILEPPSSRATLASRPLPPERVREHSPIASVVMTFGCRFSCPYCPIPAYNQRHYRTKSGERIADDFARLADEYGIRQYFGTDDNFFNDAERALGIIETLVRTAAGGSKRRRAVRWGTEATVHDTLKMKDHLPLAHEAGLRSLWLGVEDMTGTLVKKGQSVDKTAEVFVALRDNNIRPMPMMMHHDDQPLITRGSPQGLLNQVRLLRKAGAVSLQVLMITPSAGSKLYEETFTSGMVFESVGGRRVEDSMYDGNYVIASKHPRPWRKQLNLIVAYAYFYNVLRFIADAVRSRKSRLRMVSAVMQVLGMWGLCQTVRRTFTWSLRLMFCRIKRKSATPASKIPMRSPDRSPASHAIPGTSLPEMPELPELAETR